MPPEVREIFVALVASRPPEHFRAEDADLLEQHAQGIALARQAYAELAANGPVVDGRPSPWLVVLEKSHRSCVALSGRLRLAPQMRFDRKVAGTKPRGLGLSYYDLAKMEGRGDE
jgi:hypothetical protein